MLSAIRKHLTPSMGVALLALILATTGGAFAATGGGQHPTLTASAAKAKKGARGPRGLTGPAGLKGATGATGAAGAIGPVGPTGATGPAGAAGANGVGVTSVKLKEGSSHCVQGGVELTSAVGATYVCTGEEGAPGASGPKGEQGIQGIPGANGKSVTSKGFGEHTEPTSEPCKGTGGSEFVIEGSTPTYACNGKAGSGGKGGGGGGLPNPLGEGETETGAWHIELPAAEEFFPYLSMSFPIPLSKALPEANAHYIKLSEQPPATTGAEAGCPGTAEAPTAEPGKFCVYEGFAENVGGGKTFYRLGGIAESKDEGVSTAGALLQFEANETKRGEVYGTWAVTGE
jgi:hypothetical protein